MTPAEAARASDRAVGDIAARFMLDPATYNRGAELGFPGAAFYFLGRGGALGDVSADVASAAFVFFNPDTVRQAWLAAAGALPPPAAALEFAKCCHEWAEAKMPDRVDLARLAELCGMVVAGANPAGAPLFAGWRELPEPGPTKALALHRLNALRELRGALHGAAILNVGLEPIVAVAIKSPFMLQIFGWAETPETTEDDAAAWQRAEDATNEMLAAHFALLDESDLDELVSLANATLDAMS